MRPIKQMGYMMKRIIMIMPANKCDDANEWLADNIEPAAINTFNPNINANGNYTSAPSHAICNWAVGDDWYDLIREEFLKARWNCDVAEGEPDLRAPRPGRVRGQNFMESRGLKRRRWKDEVG